MTPKFSAPVGNWAWVWNARNIFGGDPEKLMAHAAEMELTGIIVKCSDGEWNWMGRNKVAQLVALREKYGVGVAGWNYSVGDWVGTAVGFEGSDKHQCTIAEELALVKQAVDLGLDFYVVDAEMEWARRDDPIEHAVRYIKAMRDLLGTYPVGFSNAPRANLGFAGYPIDLMCEKGAFDFWVPQVYINEWDVPEQLDLWVRRSVGLVTDTAMPKNMNGLPVFPAFDTIDENGVDVEYAMIGDMTDYAIKYGCRGVNWWQWEAISENLWYEISDQSEKFSTAPQMLNLPYNDSTNPAAWHCSTTDIWVVEPAFLARYEKENGRGLELFGLPWQGMDVDANGRKFQVFERARFELEPDGSVSLGRVGAELYPKT